MPTSGFEPPTFRLQVERTNHLCYTGFQYICILLMIWFFKVLLESQFQISSNMVIHLFLVKTFLNLIC